MSPTAKTAMIGVAKRAAGIFFLAAVLASAGWLAFERWVATTELPPLANGHSVTVLDRDGALLRAYTVDGGRWRLPVSPDDVDPAYVAALIAYEDKRFYRHRGVDPWALGRAFRQALVNGRIVSGGSTLTMQVARLLENSGTGRWGPKLRQIRMALALERRFSKQRILQLYLERAPYGGNLEGVRAATLSYFGKEPGRLTAAQRALLVALPQAPESRRPDRHPQAALAARNRVLSRLVAAGALLADEAEGALSEPIPTRRIAFPAMAPHLADRRVAADPARPVHRLTLRRALQVSLERLARVHVANKAPGLSAAILVMDHRSGEILASVGSAGFLDRERQGFNDMTRAIRSPGSTLKPLIYGLAFDAGLAHPETLIDDRPVYTGMVQKVK
ncbi:MAG: transglycosylase domain-containing protein, partial [Paracoccaceae bacterium]